jgi:DUF438 domain-containing protein
MIMVQPILRESSKLDPLLKEYPLLLDALINFDPKLKKLKNPILRRTVGKRATISDISSMINISSDSLVNFISNNIKENMKSTEADESMVNNLDRKEAIKQLILELHSGKDVNELKARFNELLGDVDSSEIAMIEQQLIDEGDLTVEEITLLCDLHVGIFEDALSQHEDLNTVEGHPIHTYLEENKIAKVLIKKIRASPSDEDIKELSKIIIHYTRLENQLFPALEKKQFTGPSQVMWAKHDEIRGLFKSTSKENTDVLLNSVEDMITKEEKILFPTSLEKLTISDWVFVRKGEEEIGYAWLEEVKPWAPITPADIHRIEKAETVTESLNLDTGILSLLQTNLLLKHLPLDISFVDENDTLIYYSNTEERIFPRSPGVIGRKVQNCHPQKSVHIVNEILDAFKDGSQDTAEFWIQSNGKFIHIRYFAVKDESGTYKGALEVSQDVTGIRKLEGDQRLLSWKDR